jgi:hypothetical protein
VCRYALWPIASVRVRVCVCVVGVCRSSSLAFSPSRHTHVHTHTHIHTHIHTRTHANTRKHTTQTKKRLQWVMVMLCCPAFWPCVCVCGRVRKSVSECASMCVLMTLAGGCMRTCHVRIVPYIYIISISPYTSVDRRPFVCTRRSNTPTHYI